MDKRGKAERNIHLFKVPTEAGTHFAGQCAAPEILGAQLAQSLEHAGFHAHIHEDAALEPGGALYDQAQWIPSSKDAGARNAENTSAILTHLREKCVRDLQNIDGFPVFLGGDCTITLPIFAALAELNGPERVGLMYVDGDADLTLPEQALADGTSGILDSMVVSHLFARDGSIPTFSSLGPNGGQRPLASRDNIVLFGFDPLQPQTEHWVYLVENQVRCFTRPTVDLDAEKAARNALTWLESRCDVFLLHFDVDVIDCGAFPLGNYPHYAGLSLEKTMTALRVFLGSSKVRGLVITEVNPNRDPRGMMIKALADGLVEAMNNQN